MTTADLARAVADTEDMIAAYDEFIYNDYERTDFTEYAAGLHGLTVSWQPATTGLRVPVFSVVEEGVG